MLNFDLMGAYTGMHRTTTPRKKQKMMDLVVYLILVSLSTGPLHVTRIRIYENAIAP